MNLEIISPEKKVFSDEVKIVTVPGSLGSFQMLKNHAPIVSTLEKGNVVIKKNDDSKVKIPITSGLLECKNNRICILIEN